MDRAEYDEYAEEGMAIAERVMTKLAAFLSKRDIKLTIVVFPHPIQLLKKDLDSLHVKFWRDWTTRNKADFINLYPYFINNRDPEEIYRDFYIPYDIHFNPKGHAFFASSLETC